MTQVVFFGSSPFSCVVLERLVTSNKCQVTTVVTNPDKPAGRHLKLTPNPVKVLAEKHNIPVYTSPPQLPSPRLGEGSGGEVLGLVAAFGQILSQEVLDSFGGKMYNIHPSLLPKYRGPSPLQQQILDGVTETGVTIIQMDAQMDHGPIVAVAHDTIRPDDTTVTLGNRLFEMGADLFLQIVHSPEFMVHRSQDHKEATYTKKLARQDGFVPWDFYEQSTMNHELDRKKRAFVGWPGVWTIDPGGKRIKLDL